MGEIDVLVVDRDEGTRLATAETIREGIADASVLTAGSIATATDALGNQPIDVVVTGFNLPDGTGLELADELREAHPGTACILYTVADEIDTESFEDVVIEFVSKDMPDADEHLLALIDEAGVDQTQAAHPVPDTEECRLEAAEALQDNSADLVPLFERLTTLAVAHFDARAAALTLVLRECQEPLATAGPDLAPRYREKSLAAHVLVTEYGSMAVEDTRTDPRFSDVEAIQSAGIVSYLGTPVRNEDGEAVCVLGVFDDQPRTFRAADRSYIEELAALAEEIFALEGDWR